MEHLQAAIGHAETLLGQIDEYSIPESKEHPEIVSAIRETLENLRHHTQTLIGQMSPGMHEDLGSESGVSEMDIIAEQDYEENQKLITERNRKEAQKLMSR